jgi:hypothetical protein
VFDYEGLTIEIMSDASSDSFIKALIIYLNINLTPQEALISQGSIERLIGNLNWL